MEIDKMENCIQAINTEIIRASWMRSGSQNIHVYVCWEVYVCE